MYEVKACFRNCTGIQKKLENLDLFQKGSLHDCLNLFDDDIIAELRTTFSDLSLRNQPPSITMTYKLC